MKKIFLIAVVLLASASRSPAEDDPALQQLLDSARHQEFFFAEAPSPYDLEADFTAQIKGPTPGHLSLHWESKDHWWSKVTLGGFEQTKIRNGEWEYTLRNLQFTPLRVSDLFGLLAIGADYDALIADEQKTRNQRGEEMVCIKAQRQIHMGLLSELCVDSTSHQLLSDEWAVTDNERRSEQFSDYFDFQGRQYPRKIELLINGKSVISATVNSLKTASVDPTLLAEPKGAIERRHCPGMIPPKIIKREMINFGNNGHFYSGDTTASMTILTDGSVGDVQLIGPGGPFNDTSTLTALKNWKFEPAMCGKEPVVFDMKIVASFRGL